MPTKRFDQLDTTSSIHANAGLITYNTPTNGVNVTMNMSDMVTLLAPLGFDVSFDLTSQGETVSVGVQGVARHQWTTAAHTSTVIMDYQQPITGIPDGAMIKSMIIRSPWNCNIDLSYTKSAGTYQSGSTKRLQVRSSVNVPGFFLESRLFGPVTTPNQSLQLIDEQINADADIEVFNFIDPNDYIPLSQFISNYSTIIQRIDQSTALDLQDFQVLAGTTAGATITARLIYLVSFHPDWWIDVEYEEVGVQWTVDDPPSDQALQPGDVITVTSDPLDPDPLDPEEILTAEIALIDADGNEVGTRVPIPEELWTTVEPNLWIFVLPDFQQSVNIQRIIIYITGTQFTGSVALQTSYAIYFYNAPGVYTFVTDKTDDTYYDRDTDPDEINTVDTKIPDPGGRTGYY